MKVLKCRGGAVTLKAQTSEPVDFWDHVRAKNHVQIGAVQLRKVSKKALTRLAFFFYLSPRFIPSYLFFIVSS